MVLLYRVASRRPWEVLNYIWIVTYHPHKRNRLLKKARQPPKKYFFYSFFFKLKLKEWEGHPQTPRGVASIYLYSRKLFCL